MKPNFKLEKAKFLAWETVQLLAYFPRGVARFMAFVMWATTPIRMAIKYTVLLLYYVIFIAMAIIGAILGITIRLMMIVVFILTLGRITTDFSKGERRTQSGMPYGESEGE